LLKHCSFCDPEIDELEFFKNKLIIRFTERNPNWEEHCEICIPALKTGEGIDVDLDPGRLVD
jgi:hypothetical protein